MDTNLNYDLHELQTEITKPSIVRKVKYDPAENVLKAIFDGIIFDRGELYIYDPSSLEYELGISATSMPQLDTESASKIASKYETSITRHRKIWERVPGVDDYFELDALDDVDEIESAFYKASEEHGW